MTTVSCHGDAAGPVSTPATTTMALLGAPNVGKSTLFNALTGSRRTTGNWPGTTVAVGRGTLTLGDASWDLLDLPGAFSFEPVSPDERLTRDLVIEAGPEARPHVLIVLVDASALARSLYLLAQVRELPQRAVVVLTMVDVARDHGLEIDVERLADAVGVPVVPLDPRRRSTADAVFAALTATAAGPAPEVRTGILTIDDEIMACCGGECRGDCACCAPAAADGGSASAPLSPAVSAEQDPDAAARAEDLDLALADERFAWISSAIDVAVRRREGSGETRSDRIDRIVLAPVLGPLVFLAVMWAVFQITTTVAAPLQDLLDRLLSGPVTSGASWLLEQVGLRQTFAGRLVVDGLLSGVGMLLTFLPVMGLMFGLLALLEDSGYMARAAVVADRAMRTIGLPGRAFLPLIVGFGCNVPAISGTRVLPDARHRLLTAMLVPFTSCSARLTVYVMMGSLFFPQAAGTVVFAMYLTSILFVVGVGRLLRSTLLRAMPSEPLVLDLPAYHVPVPRLVLASTWMRVRGFLQTASGVIVGTVAGVWVLQNIPAGAVGSLGNVPVGDSAFAALSRFVTPVFTWAGFAEWHTVGALVTGFVAKEAIISSWAQTYATQGADSAGLGRAVLADVSQASGGHAQVAAIAFMVFLLAYTPCVATLAALWREIGRRWTLVTVVIELGGAWVAAVAVFQIGRLFW